MACRDVKRGKAVCEEIRQECMTAKIECKYCDFSSFAAIKQFVAELESEPQIDILINNAGVMMLPFNKTVDGFETHFGNNYLGHFMLTMLLLDKLKNAQQARVINVISSSYMRKSYNCCKQKTNFLIIKSCPQRKIKLN
jgi:NAD(P)-dependent dehydrogenase (short-subunit alcohol dehydrogenase family)